LQLDRLPDEKPDVPAEPFSLSSYGVNRGGYSSTDKDVRIVVNDNILFRQGCGLKGDSYPMELSAFWANC
jgi:hypothetical protein